MSYYNDLAFQMRLRRLPESQITEALHEVHSLSEQTGQAPEEHFGPASSYAEQFPKGNSRSTAAKIAITVFTIVAVVIGIDLVQRIFTDTALRVGSVRLFVILIAVQVVTVVAAIAADRRLPKDFAAPQERRA